MKKYDVSYLNGSNYYSYALYGLAFLCLIGGTCFLFGSFDEKNYNAQIIISIICFSMMIIFVFLSLIPRIIYHLFRKEELKKGKIMKVTVVRDFRSVEPEILIEYEENGVMNKIMALGRNYWLTDGDDIDEFVNSIKHQEVEFYISKHKEPKALIKRIIYNF